MLLLYPSFGQPEVGEREVEPENKDIKFLVKLEKSGSLAKIERLKRIVVEIRLL